MVVPEAVTERDTLPGHRWAGANLTAEEASCSCQALCRSTSGALWESLLTVLLGSAAHLRGQSWLGAAVTLSGVCFGTTAPVPAWVLQWEAEPLGLQEMHLPKLYPAHVCYCRRRHKREQGSEQTLVWTFMAWLNRNIVLISVHIDAYFIPYILASQFPPNSNCYCHVGRRAVFHSCKEAGEESFTVTREQETPFISIIRNMEHQGRRMCNKTGNCDAREVVGPKIAAQTVGTAWCN